MSRRAVWALTFILACGTPSKPTPPEPPVVPPAPTPVKAALLVTLSANIDPPEVERLTQTFAEALEDALVIEVTTGTTAMGKLPGGGVPEDCIVNSDCIRDIGSRLDVEQMLFVDLLRVGPRVQVNGTWAEAGSGQSMSRGSVMIEEGGDPPEKVFRATANQFFLEVEARGIEGEQAPRTRKSRS